MENLENSKILMSDDYALFTMSDKNRPVTHWQVKKIKDSIGKIGYINEAPILVDENLVIIDWQHRFSACKELGLPIYYQIVKGNMEQIMIELNASQKNWTLPNYINHYAKQWKEWFVYFLEFQKKYDLPITSAMALLTDTKNSWKAIKNWEWYNEYKYSEIIAEMVNRIEWFVDFAKNRYFLRALVRVYIRAWVKWLLKVEEQIMVVQRQFSTLDYCIILENIINRKKRARNRIDLIWMSDTARGLKWASLRK
jgi:hypothetical protein